MTSLFRFIVLVLAAVVASATMAGEGSHVVTALMTPPIKNWDAGKSTILTVDFTCSKTCGSGSDSQSCTKICKDSQECNTYCTGGDKTVPVCECKNPNP
jgi:hypothetical protein